MPGFILHMTAASLLMEQITLPSSCAFSIQSANDFLIGNLIPDATDNKDKTHFRNPVYKDKMMIYPDLYKFLNKYRNLLTDDSCLGYFFHLYIDRRFFKDYIPEIVEFYDSEGKITDIKSQVSEVLVRETGLRIPGDEYLTEKYYYGDYTKMNTYLARRFHLNFNLNPVIKNPGIEEADYPAAKDVLASLKEYMNVPDTAVKNLTVFNVEDLIHFLRKAVNEFIIFLQSALTIEKTVNSRLLS